MSTQLTLKDFEIIYEETYNQTLKYIVCKCSNIEDVNDLIQDTYTELYSMLKRKKQFELDNVANYIIGIAHKKIKKHYGILYSLKLSSIFIKENDEEKNMDIQSDIDVESEVLDNLHANEVWEYIKKKDIRVVKVFYLYYCLELKISQIAIELKISESNVKNILYRTIKDIRKNIKIEGDIDV